MSSPWSRRRPLVTVLVLALAAASAPVSASSVRLRSRTIGEAYAIVGADPSSPILRRRRIAQYVDLAVVDMLGPRQSDQLYRDPEDGQLQLVTSLRLRHEFGTFRTAAGTSSAARLEAMDGRQIDLLWGYLRGDRLARGWVDFRLGRQFETSGLDWFVLDGGWTRLRLPMHLGVEVFGGFSSPGASMFGTPTFDLDGTNGRSSDRALRPTAGAAMSIIETEWVAARVAYRRTFTAASLSRHLPGEDGSMGLANGVDQEVVSATAALRFVDGAVSPHGSLRFDPGVLRLTDLSAGIGWAITDGHTLRATFLRTRPVFDMDSIFNVFATGSFEDIRVAYEVQPGAGWRLAARGRSRLTHARETSRGQAPERRTGGGAGGGVAASWQTRRFAARFDTDALGGGEGGLQVVSALDTRTHVAWDRLALDARAYAAFYDEPSVMRTGWAAAVQAGVDARLWRGLHVAAMAEETFSPLTLHSLRVWAVLGADWTFRGGPR